MNVLGTILQFYDSSKTVKFITLLSLVGVMGLYYAIIGQLKVEDIDFSRTNYSVEGILGSFMRIKAEIAYIVVCLALIVILKKKNLEAEREEIKRQLTIEGKKDD